MDEENTTSNMEVTKKLAKTLQKEIDWFQQVAETSLLLYFKNKCEVTSVYEIKPPKIEKEESPYSDLIEGLNLDFDERLVLILAMLPYLKPNILDIFLIENKNLNSNYSEFGGIKEANKSRFFPTLETACFILGGDDLKVRLQFLLKINAENIVYRKGILEMDSEQKFKIHQKLQISAEYFGLFTTGERHLPKFSIKFPAKKITTNLEWKDFVAESNLLESLLEINDWLVHSSKILKDWNLERNLKKGCRALFYGPSGTGKTLTATLLGKQTNKPVYRIDLSLVVSKYIGETEKNLERLFDEAEQKDWILFFDEADAIFGKRTNVRDAHDRYANQEISYLLQRIEDFSGLVILSTTMKSNIDEAFTRRFQSIIYFPKPEVTQRKLLWKNLFKENFELESAIDIDSLAETYELTGGQMINVLRYCALEAAKRNEKKVLLKDVIAGIRKEYSEQNKTM